MTDQAAVDAPQQEMAGSIAGVREELKTSNVSFLLSQAVGKVLRDAGRSSDFDQCIQRLDDGLQELHTVIGVLTRARDSIADAERLRSEEERFGGDWWRRRQREIEDSFLVGRARGRDIWLQTYAEILAAWRLDLCAELAAQQWTFPSDDGDLLDLFRAGTDALLTGRYSAALPMLEHLASVAEQAKVAPSERAVVVTLIGRIHLYALADVVGAVRAFETAISLDRGAGLPHAGLGAAYRATQEQQAARRSFTEAVKRAPQEPDGYIGMAMLCEDLRSWTLAREWYDRAVRAVEGQGPFDKLLAPTSGALYRRLARHRRKNGDLSAAAQALERAIEIGIEGGDDYPERKAYEELGQAYAKLGDRDDAAAEAFFEAARRYSWRNEEKRAVELLTRSLRHAPDTAYVLWQLAESLRVLSYRPDPPYIDEEGKDQVGRSLAAWNRASELQAPDEEWAWVFVSRALINDQREKFESDWEYLRSEAAVYLERALLLDPSIVEGWSSLGRQHRLLANPQAAHEASARALELDPTNLGALENEASALAELGAFEEAEKVLNERLTLGDDPWTRSVMSHVLMCSGRPAQGLEEISRAIEKEPFISSHRAQRARCYEYLGDETRAEDEHRWLFDNADTSTPLLWPPTLVGWAAYRLGRMEEAIRLYETALRDGTLTRTFVHADLGQLHLAKGDVARGEEELRLGVEDAENEYELEVIEFDLDLLERSKYRVHSDDVDSATGRVRTLIDDRRAWLKRHPRDVRAELMDTLASANGSFSPSHPIRLALTAALARVELTTMNWAEAAGHYRELVRTGLFPEARLGLADALRGRCEQLDEAMRGATSAQALEGYETLIRLGGDTLDEDGELLRDLHVRAAIGAFELGRFELAHSHLTKAPRPPEQRLGDAVARVARSFIDNPTRFWELDRQLAALVQSMPEDPICADVEEARRAAAVFFDEYCRLGAAEHESAVLSLVLPVSLEVGRSFEPPEVRSRLETLLEPVPERLRADTGVTVPAIHIIVDDRLDVGSYVVKLDEVDIDRGLTLPGMVYVEDEAGEGVALSPWIGGPGRWVPSHGADAGDLPMCDPVEFAVRHVETVLRRNLPHFLGMEEVTFWVEDWASTASPDMVARVAREPAAIVLLTRVLRYLVREMVPICDAETILRTLAESWPRTVDLLALTRAVRLRLRESLPGQERPAHRVPWLSSQLEACLSVTRDGPYCVIPRLEALDVLDRIDSWARDEGINLAAVTLVTAAEIRPFVWRLLASRYPMVAVLSEEERVDTQEGFMGPEGASAGTAADAADR